MPFSSFPLSEATLYGIENAKFAEPMPIQSEVIPSALEGRDILGCAQTGTGKTAAYLIPIIELLADMGRPRRYRPRALVVVPTRELAQQVLTHFRVLAVETELSGAAVYGGEDIGGQDRAFMEGIHLLVATPGRLLEHLRRGALKLSEIAFFVIDEADRLFDHGFLPDLRKIVDELPERRQTMLFSATLPPEMERLAREIMAKPLRVQVGEVAPREKIRESAWPVAEHQKVALLQRILAAEAGFDRALVFVRTRAKAAQVAAMLRDAQGRTVAELHADLTQAQRNAALAAFRAGTVQVLVATDVAARGLDIEHLTHVVNLDVPNTPDDYIHRIGRTGRVDRDGVAITLVSPRELVLLAAIEAAIRRRVPTERLPGFDYEEGDETGPAYTPSERQGARSFTRRDAVSGKKAKPFTKDGKLAKEFRTPEDERPRRAAKKRSMKKIMNKKLRHQRGNKGSGG